MQHISCCVINFVADLFVNKCEMSDVVKKTHRLLREKVTGANGNPGK